MANMREKVVILESDAPTRDALSGIDAERGL